MSVPVKYRELGDFPAYYSGEVKAPILTIFIGGNHEAASHLWELYYGGWVAPNIYYLGAANVLRFGPLRIAGMSGIWKGFDYNKPHIERLPFNQDDVKAFYHVREFDVRKLLLIRGQVDVGLSHDWPRAIENNGDEKALWRMKPDFRQESLDGTLGNPAAGYVVDRLRPAHWFSAHMHCKFSAIKKYDTPKNESAKVDAVAEIPAPSATVEPTVQAANPDEIDLDMDDDEAPTTLPPPTAPATNNSTVPDDIRALLPASFARPAQQARGPKTVPGQPVPPTITNTETRFLALDKAMPGRKFIQLCYLKPVISAIEASSEEPRLEYDPEWLAITRVFHQYLTIGDREAKNPVNEGEAVYLPMIDKERIWVEEHVVQKGKLVVPKNFTLTAPPHVPGLPEKVDHQPDEYTNPQTTAFCELLELTNLWDATPEERAARKAQGPLPEEQRANRGGGRGGRGGGGRGGGFGRGGRGGGRGRGRGRSRGGWH
jgi:lariat debranching enzyme